MPQSCRWRPTAWWSEAVHSGRVRPGATVRSLPVVLKFGHLTGKCRKAIVCAIDSCGRSRRQSNSSVYSTHGLGMRYVILISLLLLGCSTSDPIRVGDNRYRIFTTSYTGWSTRAGQIQRAMDDANDFCAKSGKVAQLQGDRSHGQPALTPVTEDVEFTCVTGVP